MKRGGNSSGRIFGVIGGIIVLSLGYWFLLFQPLQQDIEDVKQEIDTVQASIDQLLSEEEAYRGSYQLPGRRASLEQRAAQLLERIPPGDEIEELTQVLSVVAEGLGIESVGFEYQHGASAAGLQGRRGRRRQTDSPVVPVVVKMELRTDYARLMRFVKALQGLERLVTVEMLSLSGESPHVIAELTLQAFALHEDTERIGSQTARADS